MILSTRNLGWGIRGKPIVDSITLNVIEGETLGLIGPNGSGKSTLLRLLPGILPPHDGEVFLEGRPLHAYSRREAAQRLALVEQQAETGERLSARDAVELGRTPWLSAPQPWSEHDDEIVSEALAAVDMTSFSERLWHTLSGGERQRLHIARALAQEPRLLLLDEPTNHLDIEHQMSILRLVRKLPVTTVIAMHDLNQAMECDRVCVLHRGRMVALGEPSDILTVDILREVFRVRARFLHDPEDGTSVMRFVPLETSIASGRVHSLRVEG
ncbi:ABC transporter ATP-binding protein [Chelativorans sp. YIM 93263]|uniref:ABC transporter ATP-binding protein n=1 Tax=Chelativorans sp. YIM 93263 TaxID=2906648 RepID=UPI0023792048|nr:ABC transporter ATP-binding protein [Chelativorans sp. YIM 93263]